MKTVITIVFDEEKQFYGWRLDRNNSNDVLKELSSRLIDSDENCHGDTLEEMQPIPDWLESCLFGKIIPEIKEQLKPYDVHNQADHTAEVF